MHDILQALNAVVSPACWESNWNICVITTPELLRRGSCGESWQPKTSFALRPNQTRLVDHFSMKVDVRQTLELYQRAHTGHYASEVTVNQEMVPTAEKNQMENPIDLILKSVFTFCSMHVAVGGH